MSARKVENTERINVFLPASVLEQLRETADERGTTVSGMVRMIVLEWLRNEAKKDR